MAVPPDPERDRCHDGCIATCNASVPLRRWHRLHARFAIRRATSGVVSGQSSPPDGPGRRDDSPGMHPPPMSHVRRGLDR
jgi:hypothetical protein